jgi:uncharacterized protein YuzE
MKLKVDRKADALYLRFDDSKIIESEQVAPGVIVDFDNRNRVVGVEVLDVSKRKPAATRAAAPSLVREHRPKYGRRK